MPIGSSSAPSKNRISTRPSGHLGTGTEATGHDAVGLGHLQRAAMRAADRLPDTSHRSRSAASRFERAPGVIAAGAASVAVISIS